MTKLHKAKTISQPKITKNDVLLKPVVLMVKNEAVSAARTINSVDVECNLSFVLQLPHTSLLLANFDQVFIAVCPHAGHVFEFTIYVGFGSQVIMLP
ncbi:MAG: hypothetical protein MUO51_09170 [Woeseiaceae bacterium]|nr:hypothetical protein [Woeseiaceae bacterium]